MRRSNRSGPVSLACFKVHEAQHSPCEPEPAPKCMRMVAFRTYRASSCFKVHEDGIDPKVTTRRSLGDHTIHYYLNPALNASGQFRWSPCTYHSGTLINANAVPMLEMCTHGHKVHTWASTCANYDATYSTCTAHIQIHDSTCPNQTISIKQP